MHKGRQWNGVRRRRLSERKTKPPKCPMCGRGGEVVARDDRYECLRCRVRVG